MPSTIISQTAWPLPSPSKSSRRLPAVSSIDRPLGCSSRNLSGPLHPAKRPATAALETCFQGLHLCEAAIHKQLRSRDVAAVVGCEKHHGLRDLIGVYRTCRAEHCWKSSSCVPQPLLWNAMGACRYSPGSPRSRGSGEPSSPLSMFDGEKIVRLASRSMRACPLRARDARARHRSPAGAAAASPTPSTRAPGSRCGRGCAG